MSIQTLTIESLIAECDGKYAEMILLQDRIKEIKSRRARRRAAALTLAPWLAWIPGILIWGHLIQQFV